MEKWDPNQRTGSPFPQGGECALGNQSPNRNFTCCSHAWCKDSHGRCRRGRRLICLPLEIRLHCFPGRTSWLWRKECQRHNKCDFFQTVKQRLFEPAHEIMVLFVLRKLILQTRMRSHPVGLDVWFLVRPFVYFNTLYVQTAKALARPRGCAGSPDPCWSPMW